VGVNRPALPQPQAAQTAQALNINSELQSAEQGDQSDTVQIRIGGFETVVTDGADAQESIFGGQVFLLRNVQIEDRHFLQGFQLNENKLIEEVEESAAEAISTREGMGFELVKSQSADWVPNDINEDAAYTAILDFSLGYLALNLIEIDPDRIGRQISWLRNWYFGIITVVLLVVTLGLASLWRNSRTQLILAQKKDDFISAVSHELRTPLTSIRMYSEMLEKNWVKSEDKVTEYYGSMRQESERLSRLIENVLDFSRIQKGQKQYTFSLGDINECIADVVEMMTPYAAQNGFSIKTEPGSLGQTVFDRDVVTQIVVNLLDNAIKYARDAKDKTITVRTGSDDQFVLIEVEDHGPGIPHRLRYKVFEQFYRTGAEATRETTGTGLGLALVKKFAQAHNGFVEIINAKPNGAIFRVALAAQGQDM
jgi:signal transduction histidine kinase